MLSDFIFDDIFFNRYRFIPRQFDLLSAYHTDIYTDNFKAPENSPIGIRTGLAHLGIDGNIFLDWCRVSRFTQAWPRCLCPGFRP